MTSPGLGRPAPGVMDTLKMLVGREGRIGRFWSERAARPAVTPLIYRSPAAAMLRGWPR